jgi:hypothetical protein
MTTSTPSTPFHEQEYRQFREEDRDAAKHMVLIMLGIFVLALIGYSVIAILVGS